MLIIDGAQGEGGGQILRSSLALSMVTGTPFRIVHVRARRPRPGLLHQHLAAVRAAASIAGASVEGAALGSEDIVFRPGPVQPGRHACAIGSAGSTTLVLQTVLPSLLCAPAASELTIEGATHNPHAPPFEFLARAFLPLLARMGPCVTATLERAGFYPRGGGRLRVVVEPAKKLAPLDLHARGPIRSVRATATVAGLSATIADRELRTLRELLPADTCSFDRSELDPAVGPGNVVSIEIASEHVTEVFTGFGERHVPAERVAEAAASQAVEYLSVGVPVGRYLADQLLLTIAIAGRGSFRTLSPSSHARTQVDVIRAFTGIETRCVQVDERVWEMAIGPPGAASSA